MSNGLVKAEQNLVPTLSAKTLEQVLVTGDLKELSAADRVNYVMAVCKSTGLNHLTRPFDYLVLNGKLILYARKDAADQLRAIHNITVKIKGREVTDQLSIVTAWAKTPSGREDESIGAVAVAGLRGADLANALMKSESKAKRRVTLSICGLGMLDETEIDGTPDAHRVKVDFETGEILEALPNTAEAQQSVLTEQLAKAERGEYGGSVQPAEQKSDQPPPRKAKPKFDYNTMLDNFALLKAEIGKELYYQILGANGYEHANEFKTAEDGRRVYREMAQALVDLRLKQAEERPQKGDS